MAVPARVLSRLVSGLKKFQPILENAKTRDVNESDTVTILADILQDVFGYDKYTDITSEHAIRGTYVDLAIKHDGKLILLIEVKAVNTDLKEAFVKQAVDYATNQGVDWVILTNGIIWKVFKGILKTVGFVVSSIGQFFKLFTKGNKDLNVTKALLGGIATAILLLSPRQLTNTNDQTLLPSSRPVKSWASS